MPSSGARPLSRAQLDARRLRASTTAPTRQELWAIAKTAIRALDLSPSQVAVLYQVVASWHENPIAGRFIVWPSNATICRETKLSERQVRYCLRELMELRILLDKPSANGKRFLDRETGEAFGFDLMPLIARKDEFEALDRRRRAFETAQGQLRRAITVCRRASEEALRALSDAFPGVSCDDLKGQLLDLRARSRGILDHDLLVAWTRLQELAESRFYSASGGTDCRHIESNPEPSEVSCGALEDEPVERPEPRPLTGDLVVKACPAAVELAGAPIRTQNDLVEAAERLRPMIGISPDAWREAVELVGRAGAAAMVFYTVQMEDRLRAKGKPMLRPGGYFRTMVRRQWERSFSVEAALMGLVRGG